VDIRTRLKAELSRSGVITFDGFRWRDGYAWCELRPAPEVSPNALYLRYLWASQCGQGHGTRLLRNLTAAADSCGADLYLDAEPFAEDYVTRAVRYDQVRPGGLSGPQLQAWYAKHGFVPGRGHSMLRKASTAPLLPAARLAHPGTPPSLAGSA
jgi:GNAT superfamily N-acetyltransferase